MDLQKSVTVYAPAITEKSDTFLEILIKKCYKKVTLFKKLFLKQIFFTSRLIYNPVFLTDEFKFNIHQKTNF